MFLEAYDTESVNDDIQINDENSNIAMALNNKQCMDGIIHKFNISRRMSLPSSIHHLIFISFVFHFVFVFVVK